MILVFLFLLGSDVTNHMAEVWCIAVIRRHFGNNISEIRALLILQKNIQSGTHMRRNNNIFPPKCLQYAAIN